MNDPRGFSISKIFRTNLYKIQSIYYIVINRFFSNRAFINYSTSEGKKFVTDADGMPSSMLTVAALSFAHFPLLTPPRKFIQFPT